MKTSIVFPFVSATLTLSFLPFICRAGETEPAWTPPPNGKPSPTMVDDPFERAIRPITNPVLFNLAVPRTQLHPIFIHQTFPGSVETTIGSVPVDGDFQLYALQFEYAFSDTFSLVAEKDGYIHLDPDHTLSDASGWANLAAGFKWAFRYDPEKLQAASLSLVVEAPTGNTDVFQGTGDGAATPILSYLKLYDRFQFAGALGAHLPFDNDEESTTFFTSVHLSYALTERVFPLVELNYFRVLDEGDGGRRFSDQVGGAVPAVAEFEGGDLINLGAANADENPDFLSLGVGLRFRATDSIDLGFAYEFPLGDESDGLMDSRLTLDLVYRF